MTDPATDQRPSTVLKNEHQTILRVCRVLENLVSRMERGEDPGCEALGQCVEFIRLFADACHHAKEEDLLFPVLESRGIPRDGGPIGVMLYEHTQARGLTKEMGEALADIESGSAGGKARFQTAARQYIGLLSNHIHKEDNILYVMGDRVMTEEDQGSLCSKFCEVGCRSFGGKRREELEAMADDLEKRWLAP